MQQDVGIAVPDQAALEVDRNAAEDQLPSARKPMSVAPVPDPQIQSRVLLAERELGKDRMFFANAMRIIASLCLPDNNSPRLKLTQFGR